MSNKPTFRELFQAARKSLTYKVEGAIIEFTEQICERMLAMKMSKAELASKLGSSAPYITKLLKGGTNFTLESMVKVSDALDSDVRIEVVPRFTIQDWIDVTEDQSEMTVERLAWANRSHKRQYSTTQVIDSAKPERLTHGENEICTTTAF